VTDGKLIYLKMVKGEEDSVYLRLHNKFVKLVDMMNEKSVTTTQNVTYIETLPMLEFEKKHSTEVVITTSENSHRYAHFIFGGKNAKASVNKNITPDEEKDKKHLAISLCIDEKGDTFWLVHTIDKIIAPKKKEVDIDELNRNLDLLLSM
jgi:hypothetical protein